MRARVAVIGHDGLVAGRDGVVIGKNCHVEARKPLLAHMVAGQGEADEGVGGLDSGSIASS